MGRHRVAAALAALLLTSACSQAPTEDVAGEPTRADPAPTGEARPTPDAAESTPGIEPGTDDLAELAEELAGDEADRSTVPPRDEPVLGADMSWPQCPKGMGIPERPTQGSPPPIDAAEYVILGLTNGPGFTPNPCLADQVQWVKDRGLLLSAYAVLSYPTTAQLDEYGGQGPFDAEDRLGRLRNVGYQQAAYGRATMQAAGLRTPAVWLDVETVPDFDWTGDRAANAAVIQGAAKGYRDAGFAIGVYSTPYTWGEIAGDFALGVPEWRAAGQTSRAEAERRCGADQAIQGGEAVLGQWVEAGRDQNITCNGSEADLARWFHAT